MNTRKLFQFIIAFGLLYGCYDSKNEFKGNDQQVYPQEYAELIEEKYLLNSQNDVTKSTIDSINLTIKSQRISLDTVSTMSMFGMSSAKVNSNNSTIKATFYSNRTVCENEDVVIDFLLEGGYYDYYQWWLFKDGAPVSYLAAQGQPYGALLEEVVISNSTFGSGTFEVRCLTTIYGSPNVTQTFVSESYDINFAPLPCEQIYGCQDPCDGIGGWDTRNCYLGSVPNGTTAFIWDNNFYYTPINSNVCPLPGSGFDGANCFVMDIPEKRNGFIYNNNFYITRKCDPKGPCKKVDLKMIKIKDDKQKIGANKIGYRIAVYDKSICGPYSWRGENDVLKIKNNKVNKWVAFNPHEEVTNDLIQVCPGFTISILLFEYDWVASTQDWNFNCNLDLNYKSNNNPFGKIDIPYFMFVDNANHLFELEDCTLILGSSDN